jgi:hypothetical protein
MDCEDSKPCPICGQEYVFVVDSDPGSCGGCQTLERDLAELDKVRRRDIREQQWWDRDA